MMYLNSQPEQQKAMFRATAEAGLRHLRMDFAVGLVFPRDHTDFSAVDRVNALAARYGVQVLGVITNTPWYIGARPGGAVRDRSGGRSTRERWRRHGRRGRAPRVHVRHWELGNEPDADPGFAGDPHEYARWAALAARASAPRSRGR